VPCRSANRPAACAKVQSLRPKSLRGTRWQGDTGTISRVEGSGLRVAEMPGHRWPRRGSADETRRMLGAWVFMAPACCTAPFPALKPNHSRLFLSARRGDYPKAIPTNTAQWDARVASTHFTKSIISKPRMNSGMIQFLGTQIPRRRLRSSFMARSSYKTDTMQRHFGVIKLFFGSKIHGTIERFTASGN
jgi:hypothetical protein